ncbi:MAG TPA: HU family DNA-binding protein [Candidatus Paceibacterota bacterium]|jgi:DNA-binding protein HU-beta|nr:HU family DNA-binding protein [Candidatus Paceibacterota bacterium]HRV32563.1 HU family DNA-binding protein [Candidatus Paceibacterota bacterium]
MKKEDLVELVHAKTQMTKKEAEDIINGIFDSIAKALKKGEDTAISGFGIFTVKSKAARVGINPKTGEKINIAAKKVAKFRPAKALKELIK